ncbi:MAG: class I SAM-dependent methyltransferase [Promethearchaeota archaeon]
MKKENQENFYFSGQHYDSLVRSKEFSYKRILFYGKQSRKYGDPVLELACGTGEVSIPISKEGLSVWGLDFSEIMLRQAEKKSKELNLEIKWLKGDMTNFNLKERFSSIIMPGAAWNWILENNSMERCLSCVKKHLKQNGRFIFDAFNPDLNILQRDPSKRYPLHEYPNPHAEGNVIVIGTNRYEKSSQILYHKAYYEIGDKEIIKELKLRMYFPQELDALLYYNGFIIDQKFGTYDEEPFNSDSNTQIVICHKK